MHCELVDKHVHVYLAAPERAFLYLVTHGLLQRLPLAPHLTRDTNGKVTTSQLDITNESKAVSPFPAGDHNASKSRCE